VEFYNKTLHIVSLLNIVDSNHLDGGNGLHLNATTGYVPTIKMIGNLKQI